MGNTTSNAITKVNEVTTTATNNFFQQNLNETTTISNNTQTISLVGAKITNCGLTVKQNIVSSTTIKGQLTSENLTDFVSSLKNAANTEIDQQAEQKNGWLSTSIANDVNNRQDIKNKVNNIIENTITLSNMNKIYTDVTNRQLLDLENIEITCSQYRKQDIDLSQNIQSQLIADGIADLLTTAMTDLIQENSDDTRSGQRASQQNTGLEGVLQALLQALMTPLYASIAVAVVIVLIIISSSASMMLSKSGGGGGGLRGGTG